MAKHVYNLDLNDLPLDRLSEQKSKRVRRTTGRTESSTPGSISESGHNAVSRQDSNVPDGQQISKHIGPGLIRSYSETSLAVKRRSTFKPQVQ